jgi:hypothetical protein
MLQASKMRVAGELADLTRSLLTCDSYFRAKKANDSEDSFVIRAVAGEALTRVAPE